MSCSKNGDFEIKPCTCQVSNKIFKIIITVLHFNTVYLVNRHLTFNLMRLVVRMCETASNCNIIQTLHFVCMVLKKYSLY